MIVIMEMFYFFWHIPLFFSMYFCTEKDENTGKKILCKAKYISNTDPAKEEHFLHL